MERNDQLSGLRELIKKSSKKNGGGLGKKGKTIAFFGPRGGSGKTVFCLNFAISFLRKGAKIVILDADFSCPNIHALIGLTPKATIKDYLEGKLSGKDIILSWLPELDIIPGILTPAEIEIGTVELRKILNLIENLKEEYDFIFIDTSSSFTWDQFELIRKVDFPLLITIPEQPSLKASMEFLKEVEDKLTEKKKIYHIFNKLHSIDDPYYLEMNFYELTENFTRVQLEFLSFFTEDKEVFRSVIKQKPYLLEHPFEEFALKIKKDADILMKFAQFKPKGIDIKKILTNYIEKI